MLINDFQTKNRLLHNHQEIIDCSQPKRPGSQPLCLRTQKKARVKRVQGTQGYLNILLTFQFFHEFFAIAPTLDKITQNIEEFADMFNEQYMHLWQ